MARRAHMAEPCEPTWTHVDAYVVQGGFGLAFDGPTGKWTQVSKGGAY